MGWSYNSNMNKSLGHKFLNLLIVRRPELAGKWWHRLANVLIYGSATIVLLLGLVIILSDPPQYPTIFTFTSGTQFCTELRQSVPIHAPNIIYNSTPTTLKINAEALSQVQINTLVDNDCGLFSGMSIKYSTYAVYVFESLIISLVWFIFWESIIYRAIVYIVYGKKG